MPRPTSQPWLNRFAIFTAAMTLVLVGIGGLVTSSEAGMSVPDWPTTYGYNMFLFPYSKWVGGIRIEHPHRLVATIVGVLIVILMRWLGGKPSQRPLALIGLVEMLGGFAIISLWPNLKGTGYFLTGIGSVVLLAGLVWVKNGPAGKMLVRLGWAAFWLVQFQGLLGGLRVVLYRDQIGIFHGVLAQLFFSLTAVIVLLTTRWWGNLKPGNLAGNWAWLPLLATLIIFSQLVLGATMRHQHAGLAISDFPLAHHKLWPPTDAASVASYNQLRMETKNENPITAAQILMQMAHRLLALAIAAAVAACAWTARKQFGAQHPLARLSLFWLALIGVQIFLGAETIWSNKAADIATAHVVVGAMSLVTGALLTIISFRVMMPVRAAEAAIVLPSTASAK